MHDGADLWMSCSLPLYAVGVGAAALLITALFFVGPALAGYTARRPLLGIVENSLGSIPASGLRFCCVMFLMLWIARSVSWLRFGLLPSIMRRDVTTMESGVIAVGILVFVVISSFQSLRTSAKLALFTNKLGLAILVAASIRVRQGLPAALNGYQSAGIPSEPMAFWHGLSLLAFDTAPLAFLAANFGYRSHRRKSVAMTALVGIAAPLAGTLLLVGVINVALIAAGYYQLSPEPSVAMDLWWHVAHSALPGRMLVAAITTFGAMRFGIRSLAESASVRSLRSWWSLVLLGCLASVTAWFSFPMFEKTFEPLATSLAVAAAVLTADFVTRSWLADRVRRFDRIGVIALLAGLATPLYVPGWMVGAGDNQWWHPWLLPSYGVAFLVCVLGRSVSRFKSWSEKILDSAYP